jgi:hypothetical protein
MSWVEQVLGKRGASEVAQKAGGLPSPGQGIR